MKLSNISLLIGIKSLALGLILGGVTPTFAQRKTDTTTKSVPMKPVVKYRDWSVYRHKGETDTLCFAASAPKDMIPEDVKRSEVLFYVTRWKSNPKKAQVSVLIGYPFKRESKPDIKIKGQEYKLFVKGDKAWIRDEGDEVQLIRSMRAGSKMTVTGLSESGVVTTDEYSLSGVSKALNRIKRLCR